MKHKTPSSRFIATCIFAAFISNTLAPTIQYTFAANTQYYVDATLGSDANNGLSIATPWQSLTHVNTQVFSQGDTVSFLCGESWTGTLDSVESGIIGSPITYNAYGTGCTTTNRPQVENMSISGASFVNINSMRLLSSSGNAGVVNNSNNINITNSQFSFSGIGYIDLLRITSTNTITISGNSFSGVTSPLVTGVRYSNSTNVTIDNNSFDSNIMDAINIINSNSTIQNNTIQYTYYGIFMTGTGVNLIQNNMFPHKSAGSLHSAIAMGPNTTIQNNTFYASGFDYPCVTDTDNLPCGVIQNNYTTYNTGTIYNSTITNNYIEYGRGDGIVLSSADSVNISSNTIKYLYTLPGKNGIRIIDSSNIAINSNTILNAPRNSVGVTQNTPGTVSSVTMNTNTLFQRNIDYPYIEMRDETPGTGTASLITANGNNFVTLYKPDSSYVRSVKFGGETVEYTTKSSLNLFDGANTRFQSFGYKPYTNTGTYATANLLTNPSFEVDVTGWTASASGGLVPVLTRQGSGSYSGSSMIITPQASLPDRMRVTNNAILNIGVGEVYEVSGYLRSTVTGSLNIRGSLHKAGDISTIYSDRIAETYSTSTGRVFSYYIYATSTVADAQFTLETSNQNIPLEIDEMSLRRKTVVTKNTDANEVLIFSNTGGTLMNQGCPGGVPCAQYVDTTNTNIGWPGSNLTIPAYSTRLALWNNSSNLLTVPAVTMNIDSGSIPSGTLAHITWMIASSDTSSIQYTTSTGTFTSSITNTGELYFQPPAGATTSTYIFTENSIGPRVNQVDVTTTNTPPIVYPVTITGSEDSSQIIGTLSGVDQNPGDTVFFEKFTNPTSGTVTVAISGTASYIPNPNFCGTDTFLYRAFDQFNNFADPVTATIQLTCTNDSPIAVNDSITVTGSVTTMDVLANDTDPDSIYEVQSFTLTGFTQPIHGSIVINANKFDYLVDVGYIGPDSFTYSMVDQSGALSNTGTVTITVSVPNTPPMAFAASYTGTEDLIITNTLSGSDINPDTLSFTVSTMPTNGAVNIVGSTFTYTPTPNFFGTDSFIYRVFDGSAYSSGATISLTLSGVPDAPIAMNDSYSLIQDTTFFVPVMNNDSDVDSASGLLSLTGNTNPANGTLTLTATGYLYTPTLGYVGSDSFTYRVIDETSLLSNIATVSLTINTSNTAPIVSSGNYSLNEDTVFTGTLSGSDMEQSTLSYIIDTPANNGNVTLGSGGTFTFTPNANFYGSSSFTFHANDGLVNSNIGTISFTINSVNDLPIVNGTGYTIAGNNYASSGNTFTGILIGVDAEDLVLTYTATTLPMNGVLSLANSGSFTYAPAYGYSGADSFLFRAIDSSGGLSNTGTINFIISGLNSAPIAYSGTYMTNEDTVLNFYLSGSDPDGDMITYVQNSGPTGPGNVALYSSGLVIYTPSTDWNGTLTFTFRTNDGLLSSIPQIVTIDVLPVNDAPSTVGGVFTMTGNSLTQSGRIFVFTGSASDVDSATFTYSTSTLPMNGILSMTASGVFTYTPNIGYVGGDAFSYRANDGSANSSPAVVNITVNNPFVPTPPTPPVVVTPGIISGPGGGGGGGTASVNAGSSTATSTEIFGAAPVQDGKIYKNINGTLYTTNDPTGLAGQLYLMSRVLGYVDKSITNTSAAIAKMSDRVSNMMIHMVSHMEMIDDTAVYLRKIVQVASVLASESDDPVKILEDALSQIEEIDAGTDDRLASTQEYAIRVLKFRQKMYEEMLNRDLRAAPVPRGKSSLVAGGDTGTGNDSTGDADLDALLKLLAQEG